MTRKFTFTILAMLFAILGPGAEAWGQTVTWTRVTTVKELTDGGTFIMGYEATAKSGIIVPLRSKDCNATTSANGYFNTGITAGSSTNGTIDMSKVTETADYEVYITSPASGKINIQMKDAEGNFYGATSGGTTSNKGRLYTSGNSAETNLTPEFSSETNNQFKLTGAVTGQYKYLKYNTSSPRFAFYNSAGSNIVFYKKDSGDTPSAELVSIAISGNPDKTTYEAGEEFDPAGLVVTGTYDDGSEETITSGITWEISPSGALTAGTTSVTVKATVDGKSDTKNYDVTVNAIEGDRLTLASTGVSSGYTAWTDKTGSEGVAKYAGQSSNGNNSIQIRNQSPSGIVSTTSGGLIKKVKVDWNTNTANGRSIKIYGSNTAYTGSADVYDSEKRGEELGSIAKGTTELEITGDFAYVGILPVGGAMYLNSITFVWSAPKVLEGIAVKTAPTVVNYAAGEFFNPAGLVITATYDDETTADIAYEGNEDKFSFSPALDVALATTDEQVTITYGGKSCNQTITVNLIKLATPANLQATNVTLTSANLTWGEVANASSYEVKLNGVAKTATTNSLLVEDLTASTAYIWTVKAIGDGTTYENSEESTANNFTTLALPSDPYTVTFNAGTNGTCSTTELTESSAGAGVTLPEVTPNTGYQFVGWATTNTATEADAGVAGATYYPTANITLYAVYNSVYTITWSVNGAPTTEGNPTTSVVAGEGITTLPTAPASISGMAFQGWTATQIATSSATAPTDLFTDAEHAPAIIANTTFYAVFAEESEGDVTWNLANDIAANDVIIIATNKNYNSTMKTAGTISSNLMSCTASTFNSDKTQITSVADGTLEFTLGGNSTSGWTLQNGTNYLGMSGDKKVALSSTSSTWSISISSGVATVSQTYSSKSYSLQYNYNNGNDRFTGYTSSQVAISLYKKTQDITYTYYTVVKQLTDIELSGDYPTEFWKGEAFSHEGMTVTAHYNDGSTKDVTSSATFSTPNMTTVGEQTVTVTYDTKSITYSITVKNIANTQETAYTTAEAIDLIDANPAELATTEVYVKGTVSKIVTEWNSQYGNITFDVSEDGQTTGDQFRFYRNFKGANKTPWASAAECPAVGDDVIGVGTMKKYTSSGNVVYEFDEENYLVSHVKATTLSIDNITVSLDEEISPEITTNVPEAERTITYSVASEDVVKVQDGNLVTVAVGGPVEVTATLTAEGYKSAETTFTVEVIKALQFIAVKTAPTTTSYKEGDTFDPAGLVITANYNDESTENVTYAGNENKFTFTPSLETPLSEGNTSVTITYAGKETTQAITVRALNTYNITWKANGEQFIKTQVTEGDALVLPEKNPANVGDMAFQGWINTESYYNAETAPEYIVPSGIIPTEAMTFYAVYAKAGEGEPEETEFSFNTDNFTEITTSYTTTFTHTFPEATVEAYGVYKNGGIQMNSGKGTYIKNTTAMPGYMSKIVLTWNASGKNSVTMYANANSVASTSSDNLGKQSTTTTTHTINIDDAETKDYKYFYLDGTTVTGACVLTNFSIFYMKSTTIYSNFCTTVKPIEENTTISENATWEGNYTINGNTVTIGSGVVLTVNGALINTDPEKLVIEDGGQLIVNNSGLQATMKKHIKNTPSRDDQARSWYTISSPLAASVNVTDVSNLIPDKDVSNTSYDLYYLNEKDGVWVNARPETGQSSSFTKIDKGVGYIYSNAATTDIAFKGEVNVADVDVKLSLTADKGKDYNLIGNPFMQNITLENIEKYKEIMSDGFFVLTNQDTWGTEPSFGTIAPLQGFLVQVTETGNATISKPTPSSKGERSEQNTNIEMIVSNSIYRDNAYAMFGEGTGLNKVSHRNAQAPMLYIPQDGEDFAIAFMDENTTVFPLSFKAMTTGSYSISLKPTDDVSTLVLVDNMTGEETNMLLEDSYTFIGSPADNENRFTVKLKISNSQDEDEHFAYQNGSELVIDGEGTLQIFDVLGRVVISEEVHGQTVNVGGLNTGAYIVRLTGESVKTQKIVVR